MKKNWGITLLVLVLAVGLLEFVPALTTCTYDSECPDGQWCPMGVCVDELATDCISDDDCEFGEACEFGRCILDSGASNGDSCTYDSDCSSDDCGYEINCDKSVSACSQYCQPYLDECSRSGYFSGYDTYQLYSSWICLGQDLGGRSCTSSNRYEIAGSYYCSTSNTWVTGTPPATAYCSLVGTSNIFKVKNAAGNEIFRVDSTGNVAFQGGLFHDSDIDEATTAQFQIKGSATNSEFRVLASNRIAMYEGSKYESQSSISVSSTGDFVVKNSAGTVVFKITNTGNIYAKGKIASGCDCEEGTYYNPTDLAGNYILSTTSGTSDYAAGYCAQVHNCQTVTSFATTTTSRYACRCDYTDSFGCSGGSCQTASSSWPSYSQIGCA